MGQNDETGADGPEDATIRVIDSPDTERCWRQLPCGLRQNEQKRLSEAHDGDERQAISSNLQSYERSGEQIANKLTGLERNFQIEYEKYRAMGGVVDYQSQVPY